MTTSWGKPWSFWIRAKKGSYFRARQGFFPRVPRYDELIWTNMGKVRWFSLGWWLWGFILGGKWRQWRWRRRWWWWAAINFRSGIWILIDAGPRRMVRRKKVELFGVTSFDGWEIYCQCCWLVVLWAWDIVWDFARVSVWKPTSNGSKLVVILWTFADKSCHCGDMHVYDCICLWAGFMSWRIRLFN